MNAGNLSADRSRPNTDGDGNGQVRTTGAEMGDDLRKHPDRSPWRTTADRYPRPLTVLFRLSRDGQVGPRPDRGSLSTAAICTNDAQWPRSTGRTQSFLARARVVAHLEHRNPEAQFAQPNPARARAQWPGCER